MTDTLIIKYGGNLKVHPKDIIKQIVTEITMDELVEACLSGYNIHTYFIACNCTLDMLLTPYKQVPASNGMYYFQEDEKGYLMLIHKAYNSHDNHGDDRTVIRLAFGQLITYKAMDKDIYLDMRLLDNYNDMRVENMADSTEIHVWRTMALNFKDKTPYTDTTIINFLKQAYKQDVLTDNHNKKLLDMGCSIGLFDQLFIDAGFDVTGIDQVPEALDLARQKVPKAKYILQPADEMTFENEFDIIVSHTVLQHMKLPVKEKVLANIYKALKPDGILFIGECTFNKDNWNSVPGRSEFNEKVTDGYSYTQSGWITLLANYSVEETDYSFGFLEKHPIFDWYLFRKITPL